MTTESPNTTTWGEGVRTIRTVLGLTQQDLAAKAGVPQSTISLLERDATKPGDHIRVRIARALGVDPHELFPYREDGAA